MFSKDILPLKNIKAVGKLIIYFLLDQKNILSDGGVKTTIEQISNGIGEEVRNVKDHIKQLKQKNILRVKAGRYPVFYLKFSIERHSVPLNNSIERHSVPLNPPPAPTPIIDNVVVVCLEKHGFEFGPIILEKLGRFPVEDQIAAIESTAANAKTNPSRYIEKILDNDCKGIKIVQKQTAAHKTKNISVLKIGDQVDYNGFILEITQREKNDKIEYGAFRNDTGTWIDFAWLDQMVQNHNATILRQNV